MTGDENTQPVGTVESLSDLVSMQDEGDTVADGAEVEETEDEEADSLEYLNDIGACVLGTPEQCVEMCRRYEAAGRASRRRRSPTTPSSSRVNISRYATPAQRASTCARPRRNCAGVR